MDAAEEQRRLEEAMNNPGGEILELHTINVILKKGEVKESRTSKN